MTWGRGIAMVLAVVLVVTVWRSWGALSKLDYAKVPTRATWQLPERVVAAFDLEAGSQVADIGAGDGYFTFPLAGAVGGGGRVYAVEIEEHLVDAIERQVHLRDVANVDAVLGELDDPRLPDGGIDLVFLCNTYHHIENRTAYFARLRGDLRPSGRVAIVEMRADLTGIAGLFSHEGHSTSRVDLLGEMELAGYRHVASHDFLPVQIFEVFAPASASP